MTAQTRKLAPHVDPAWADAFVLELRLRDAPGRSIGDALAEVESHCAESGEAAAGAFGEPVPYAASLELPAGPATDPLPVRGVLRWAVQALGVLVTVATAAAWSSGEPVELTTGLVALVVLFGLTLVALGRAADRVLRFVVEHTVVAWLISMAHFAVLTALMLLLDDVLVRVPVVPALVAGALLLVVGTAMVLRDLRRADFDDDPVSATVEANGTPLRTGRTAALRYLPGLLAPASALGFIALWWLVT